MRSAAVVGDPRRWHRLTTLETAGYVDITKGHLGRRPRTWCALTKTGRQAFTTYTGVLHKVVAGNAAASGRQDDKSAAAD